MNDVIQLSTGTAASLIIAYFLTVFAFGRILLWQFERRSDVRDEAVRELRAVEAQARGRELHDVRQMVASESSRIGTLGEKFEKFTNSLPLEYVRRDDYIRGQTIIEAKLDAIASELKLVQIRGGKNAN